MIRTRKFVKVSSSTFFILFIFSQSIQAGPLNPERTDEFQKAPPPIGITPPPSVYITSPVDGFVTDQTEVSAAGSYRNAVRVVVNGRDAVLNQGNFSIDHVILGEGTNTITAVAHGNSPRRYARATIRVTLTGDVPPPVVDSYPDVTAETQITLSGSKSYFTSILINGTEVVPVNELTTWHSNVDLANEGLNTLQVVAKSRSGRESTPTVVSMIRDTMPTIDQSGFVYRNGTNLMVGNKRFYANVANQRYLYIYTDTQIEHYFQLFRSLGIKAVRVWGFNEISQYGEPNQAWRFNALGFQRMDKVIETAHRYNVRLVFPLTNNWGVMLQMAQVSNPSAVHDDFYRDPATRQRYKNWASDFLNHVNPLRGLAYKDDPTILMLDLANEPRAESDRSCDLLQTWINEMAPFVKTLAPSILLTTGGEGFYNLSSSNPDWRFNGYEGVDYLQNHANDSIDVATFRLYPESNQMSDAFALEWLRRHVADAHTVIGKPVILEEYGWPVERNEGATRESDTTIETFDVDNGGWRGDAGSFQGSEVVRVASPSQDGNGAIRVAVSNPGWTSGSIIKTYPEPAYLNLSGYDFLSAWVYLPPSAPNVLGAALSVYRPGSPYPEEGGRFWLSPGEWTEIAMPLYLGQEISAIRITLNSWYAVPPYSGEFFIDSIGAIKGFRTTDPVNRMIKRNLLYHAWTRALVEQGASAGAIWQLIEPYSQGSDEFNFYSDPTSGDSVTRAIEQAFSNAMAEKVRS